MTKAMAIRESGCEVVAVWGSHGMTFEIVDALLEDALRREFASALDPSASKRRSAASAKRKIDARRKAHPILAARLRYGYMTRPDCGLQLAIPWIFDSEEKAWSALESIIREG